MKTIKLRNFSSVGERRCALEKELKVTLNNIGSFSLDERIASGHNCENMIGVAQVPIGIAGPLKVAPLKGSVKNYFIPLATTEGALVASVNRGCKAITESGGAVVDSYRLGATRGPVFKTEGIEASLKLKQWIDSHFNNIYHLCKQTSKHLRLHKVGTRIAGRYVYVRFYFDTQDAMGMNMVTIATSSIIRTIELKTGACCISLAGNFDIDKKPAWLNFISGRGFLVWAEVTISAKVLKKILKTTAQRVYDVWLAKCMVGSVMAGSMGFNAHYANVIAAIFAATGQDLAHVVEGSLGITTCEVVKYKISNIKNRKTKDEDALYISVYLPDLMVGTLGGGTGLATQKEALELLGVAGGSPAGEDGKNTRVFAEIIAAAVLAGEISLLSSLAEGTLAKAHQKLARGGKL